MPQPETLDHYISAVDAASARSRWTYILITVASVLAFTAFWNSRHDGWIRNRIRLAQDARTLLLADENERCLLFSRPSRQRFVDALTWLHMAGFVDSVRMKVNGPAMVIRVPGSVTAGNLRPVHQESASDGDTIEDAAVRYLTLGDLTSERLEALELEAYIEDLSRMRLNTVVFLDVPFLGIHFDVNDLGVFAGFAFIVLLIMFRMSQRRELKNIRIAFANARQDGNHRQMYELLSMHQVFTVPEPYNREPDNRDRKKHPINMAWRWIACGPILLPAIVQFVILWNDRKTTSFAYTLNPEGLYWSIMLSFGFLISITFLTIDCVWLFRAITRTWDDESYGVAPPSTD